MNERKSPADFNNEPEPANIDYENLSPELDEKMRELMAKDTTLSRADAYKMAMGSVEEEGKEA